MSQHFNVMVSGITGSYPERFARDMATTAKREGHVMEIITLRSANNTLRARLGYQPTPYQIWHNIQNLAEISGKAGRTVAFCAPNLTQDDRARALTALSPLVPGPWLLCQVLTTARQATDLFFRTDKRYKGKASEGKPTEQAYAKKLAAISAEREALEIANIHEGFSELVFVDIDGDITQADYWR